VDIIIEAIALLVAAASAYMDSQGKKVSPQEIADRANQYVGMNQEDLKKAMSGYVAFALAASQQAKKPGPGAP